MIYFLLVAFGLITFYLCYKIEKLAVIFIDFIDGKIKDSDELKEKLIKFKKPL